MIRTKTTSEANLTVGPITFNMFLPPGKAFRAWVLGLFEAIDKAGQEYLARNPIPDGADADKGWNRY